MALPPNSITPGTGSWIWTNPFGDLAQPDSISASGEIDYYRFVANQSGSYAISVSGVVDSQLRIYNSSGTALTGVIDNLTNANATESATLSLSVGNWYYIAVSGFNSSTGSYLLNINGPSPVINDISTAAPTFSGGFQGGSISPAGDIDWFRLVAPAGTTSLSFSTSGVSTGLNTLMQLLDANGNSLRNVIDNGGPGSGDSDTAAIIAGATYYVGVTSLQSGAYNLNADFNPDRQLPTVSIAALSADKPEGTNQSTPFTFTVSRTGDTSGTSSVHWAIGANQSPAADASDFDSATGGDLTWGANDATPRTITLSVIGDSVYEGGGLPEHFTVNLSNAVGAQIGTATANGSIQNDDIDPGFTGTIIDGSNVFRVSIQSTDGAPIDPSRPSWLIIHGWRSSPADFNDLANAIHAQRPFDQILTLDWSEAAASPLFDPYVVENRIQPVADRAFEELADHGFLRANINLIGHSFGSYIADEIARQMPGGVNTIVALDPAVDLAGGYDTSRVDFGRDSQFSWGFHVDNGAIGSPSAPATADEAFVVLDGEHTAMEALFTAMLRDPNGGGGANQYFQLDRLLADTAGPWLPNQYDENGVRSLAGHYEAAIETGGLGTIPQWISFVPNAALAPEITVVGNTVSIADNETSPTSSDGTNFGNATLGGATVQHTFMVRNDGSAPLTTSNLLVPSGFSLVDGLSSSIPVGGFDTFTVQLNTSSLGAP